MFRVYQGLFPVRIDRIQRGIFNLLYYMRHDVIAPVGNRRSKVAYLQRGGQDFSLADGDGDNRA